MKKLSTLNQEVVKTRMVKKKHWPDSTVYDIMHRLDELSDMCAYELIIKYERGFYNGNNNGHSDRKLPFMKDRPGVEVLHLKRAKKTMIPIIYASDGFHDIADLRMGKEHVPGLTINI